MFITIILLKFCFVIIEQITLAETLSFNTLSDQKMVISNSPWVLTRSRRDQTNLILDPERVAYEKELSDRIADYYTQRTAVMNKYYARQRAIASKFDRIMTTYKPLTDEQQFNNEQQYSAQSTTTSTPIITNTTVRRHYIFIFYFLCKLLFIIFFSGTTAVISVWAIVHLPKMKNSYINIIWGLD